MKSYVPPKNYVVKNRLCISFSGGKTSAYMTKMLLDHFRDDPNTEILVTFANTGQEHEETLKFVDRCDKEFDFGVVWLEGVVNMKRGAITGFRIVNFETAARNGEPFEEIITKYGIPNKSYNHCTRELKLNPMTSYKDSVGWAKGTYSTAVGIRADEIDRVSATAFAKNLFYPCADAGVTKEDVRLWWAEQSFNLNIPEHLGNCFSGDTQYMTSEGVVTFEETEGEILEVLTRKGWEPAKIQSFGLQPIVEVTVKRGAVLKTLKTTAGHRWIVSKYLNGNRKWLTERTTENLRVGDMIPLNWADLSGIDIDPEGVRHGFSFGDGTLDGKRVRTYIAECKEEILPWFGSPVLGKARLVEKLPAHYKTPPSYLAPREYLKGFIAGLIASDGHVSSSGVIVTNAQEENAKGIGVVLDSLGVPYHKTYAVRDTNYKKGASMHTIRISAPVLSDDMILRSAHRSNRPVKRTNPKGWKVVGVRPTGGTQEVYCATVLDGPDEFTLADGVLTKNCVWCWKKSNRKLLTLMQTHPEIFEFPDRMEKLYAMAGGQRRDGEAKRPRVFFRGNRDTTDLFLDSITTKFEPYQDDKFVPWDSELDVGGACGDSCEIGADEYDEGDEV